MLGPVVSSTTDEVKIPFTSLGGQSLHLGGVFSVELPFALRNRLSVVLRSTLKPAFSQETL